MKILIRYLLLLIFVFSCTVQTFDSSAPLPPKCEDLLSIEIAVPKTRISLGTSENFSAVGKFSDGTTHIITDEVDWSSSNTNVAVILNGALNAKSNGTTQIKAVKKAGSCSATHPVNDIESNVITITVIPGYAYIVNSGNSSHTLATVSKM